MRGVVVRDRRQARRYDRGPGGHVFDQLRGKAVGHKLLVDRSRLHQTAAPWYHCVNSSGCSTSGPTIRSSTRPASRTASSYAPPEEAHLDVKIRQRHRLDQRGDSVLALDSSSVNHSRPICRCWRATGRLGGAGLASCGSNSFHHQSWQGRSEVSGQCVRQRNRSIESLKGRLDHGDVDPFEDCSETAIRRTDYPWRVGQRITATCVPDPLAHSAANHKNGECTPCTSGQSGSRRRTSGAATRKQLTQSCDVLSQREVDERKAEA